MFSPKSDHFDVLLFMKTNPFVIFCCAIIPSLHPSIRSVFARSADHHHDTQPWTWFKIDCRWRRASFDCFIHHQVDVRVSQTPSQPGERQRNRKKKKKKKEKLKKTQWWEQKQQERERKSLL